MLGRGITAVLVTDGAGPKFRELLGSRAEGWLGCGPGQLAAPSDCLPQKLEAESRELDLS